VVTADLTVPGELDRAVAGATAVIHLAACIDGPGSWRVAESDRQAERVNRDLVGELVRVLDRRGGRPVVVFSGSIGQAGRSTREIIDGTEPDRPETTYDRQKLESERELLAATEARVLRAVSVRLPTVVGCSPGSAGIGRGVVAAMVGRALGGQELTLWGDGSVRRDFLDVHDTASALVAAVHASDALAGRPWVLGSGIGTSVREMFELVADQVAAATGRPPVPVVSAPPPNEATAADQHSAVVDASAFAVRTGWAVSVPVPESVRRVVATATDRLATSS
jgi:dTDP-4-keto-6-deoxyhexose 4-ketoreductase